MLGAMSALATASVFLDLLARDAAAIEYDGPVVAARVAGAGPEELAELEAAKRVALEVRATLARSRRREAELVALFETAGDLAALRDLDAVLKAIVTRAHTLIGADVTYLTLDDPDRGDTYMRVTHGSVSARFQSLRLPMGAGLGGLVAQTAKPYVTSDYPRDARFRHTNEIDEGVGEEGPDRHPRRPADARQPGDRGAVRRQPHGAALRPARDHAARLTGRARRGRHRQRAAAAGDARRAERAALGERAGAGAQRGGRARRSGPRQARGSGAARRGCGGDRGGRCGGARWRAGGGRRGWDGDGGRGRGFGA